MSDRLLGRRKMSRSEAARIAVAACWAKMKAAKHRWGKGSSNAEFVLLDMGKTPYSLSLATHVLCCIVAKREYIKKLQSAILQRHACKASWIESLPVHDVFGGQTIWQGSVEVFTLSGHPKAKRAYAWLDPDGEEGTAAMAKTILEIPPVDSPLSAVWASNIAAEMRGL